MASACLVLTIVFSGAVYAQTNCALQHTEVGAFICYPRTSVNGEAPRLPNIFHLSAQGNAPPGKLLSRYAVMIDGRLVYENRLYSPLRNLSIETNLRSSIEVGSHTLQLIIDGAGSAEVRNINIYPAENVSFCNPFSRFDGRSCNLSVSRGTLQWSLAKSGSTLPSGPDVPTTRGPFGTYFDTVQLYANNLKSVEADTADSMVVDSRGNLYVASHAFNEVELQKHTADGSIVYDSLIHSCGDGYLAVIGIAVDGLGRAWIAGNTSSCLATTPGSIESDTSGSARIRGFVMLIDTTKPSSAAPLFVSYVSKVESRLTAIRLDDQGNAYMTGITTSPDFPHTASLMVSNRFMQTDNTDISFVSMLRPFSSTFEWSTLLPDTHTTALALDTAGNVFITGSTVVPHSSHEVLVAELSDSGRRLSYAAQFGGSASAEGRTISTLAQGFWLIIEGDTDSPTFLARSTTQLHRAGLHPFVVALHPCKKGVVQSYVAAFDSSLIPAIAFSPALDWFASSFSQSFTSEDLEKSDGTLMATVSVAPACPAETP